MKWFECETKMPKERTISERVLVATRFGVGIGWYNQIVDSWFVILEYFYECDETPDVLNGDVPKLTKFTGKFNSDVFAWMELPVYNEGKRNECI